MESVYVAYLRTLVSVPASAKIWVSTDKLNESEGDGFVTIW
jgi:hypothetical protein